MDLGAYIREIGDEKAAEIFNVKPRTAMSWRLGNRQPRPRQARRIIEATHGLVSWEDIYGTESERAVA